MSKNNKMRLRSLVDIWSFSTLLFYISLCVLHFLKRIGIRTNQDPWRYTTRVYHHLDHCSFGLTAFGLKPFFNDSKNNQHYRTKIQQDIIVQLSSFIHSYPELHKKLVWSDFSVQIHPNLYVDFVLAHFRSDGSLQGIELFMDETLEKFPIEQSEENMLFEIIIDAYNQLRFDSDETRPKQIRKIVRKKIGITFKNQPLFTYYEILDRILAAIFIHFDVEMQQNGMRDIRYSVPKFFTMRPFGFGSLNIHIRILYDKSCDLWIQFNHAVIDGVQAAQIVGQLEKHWNAKPFFFPAKGLNKFQVQDKINYHNKLPLCIATGLIEFDKLLEYRRMINNELGAELESPVTLAGMLLWGLGCTEKCKDMKFLIPIDIPEDAEHERTVGTAYIRPGKYSNPIIGREEFIAFQVAFNKQVSNTRIRNSVQYQVLEEFSILPHFAYHYSRKYLCNPMQEFIGSAALSVIKEPAFFTAPYACTTTDCIIAIGNVTIKTKNGKRAGAVTIKASEYDIIQYCEAFISVVKNYSTYVRFLNST